MTVAARAMMLQRDEVHSRGRLTGTFSWCRTNGEEWPPQLWAPFQTDVSVSRTRTDRWNRSAMFRLSEGA